ncbi:hypothetical protein Cha6605_4557 [Chamaesiphon minutus PCC 6605]|uniref:Uncharacterized protein n=1 Tax=Chamaesiphon minutus (strain ATCC 27169 / PCC 6605) TaxID=1173020 RepID=K9UM09_CHAP6|nr:hypothetical protein Cha6605_4557 [Chamaesiphon minutus PCC 6605]
MFLFANFENVKIYENLVSLISKLADFILNYPILHPKPSQGAGLTDRSKTYKLKTSFTSNKVAQLTYSSTKQKHPTPPKGCRVTSKKPILIIPHA